MDAESEIHILELLDQYSSLDSTVEVIIPNLVRYIIQHLQAYERLQELVKNLQKENEELRSVYQDSSAELLVVDKQLRQARKMIDDERHKRELVTAERDKIKEQLDFIRNLLQEKDNNFTSETGELIDKLRRQCLHTADSEDSESLNINMTLSEDEDKPIDRSGTRKLRRRSPASSRPSSKRPRSSRTQKVEVGAGERVVATTTVTIGEGPISAVSTIKTLHSTPADSSPISSLDTSDDKLSAEIAQDEMAVVPFSLDTINNRPHLWIQKAMIKGESCNVCNKKIRFSSMGAKCRDCKAQCHPHCKDQVSLPCVPISNTPKPKSKSFGTIADYAPGFGLMIPGLVVHCVKEVEERGLDEVGLYRITTSDKEVRALKEKFLRNKGIPNLSQVLDIHTVCNTLKDFLRSLDEPLVSARRREDFLHLSDLRNVDDRRSRLMELVRQLPQPNRDTLAFLIVHLQKIASNSHCQMSISNLSKMFGPSVIGFGYDEPKNQLGQVDLINLALAELLSIPTASWQDLLYQSSTQYNSGFDAPSDSLPKSSSVNSLLGYFSPSKKVK